MGFYNVVTAASMVAGQPEDVSVVLANFNAIATVLNGGIDNSNIAGAAAILASKLAGYPTDGTKVLKGDGTWGTGYPTDGWQALSALTYGTTDGHTFTATYAGDLTASVPVGSRIKLTNQAATQYFIVTAHVAGTLTLYGGTTYSITNTAITNPFFSREKAPVGFPLNPTLWTEEFTESVSRAQAAPAAGTWYNIGPSSLAIPIGVWRTYYEATLQIDASGGQADNWGWMTLSTTNNGETDVSMTTFTRDLPPTAGGTWARDHYREKILVLAAKTTYYLNFKVTNAVGTTSVGTLGGSGGSTVIRAVCAYL